MQLAVGKDLFALCGKCDATWHVVVAMDGTKVTRVQCKQCMGYHRYRPAPGEENINKPVRHTVTAKAGTKASNGRKPAASRRKTAAAARKSSRADEPAIAADLSRPVRGYTMKETYAPGDRIEHPKFGQGVVQSSTEPGKVDVFFEGGSRTLAHGRNVLVL